jgi:hypothetical protein
MGHRRKVALKVGKTGEMRMAEKLSRIAALDSMRRFFPIGAAISGSMIGR